MARMNELTEPMIAMLRKVARGDQPKPGATRSALLRRGLVEWSAPNEVALTDAGRVALDALDGKVPTAPTAPTESDPAAPSVLLSPATEPAETPDAELLQLLALLDSGVKVTRRLYQAWQVAGSPITLDPVKVDRAARAALAAGLATADRAGDVMRLTAEPIHLLARGRDGMEAVCKRRLRRAGGQRLRYTTDASKATHEACVNPRKRHPAPATFKVNDVVRFQHNGTETGRLFRVVETDGTDGDMVRVAWDNPPEDCTEEINARWVGIGMVEHEPNA